jgi:hypothetical protein
MRTWVQTPHLELNLVRAHSTFSGGALYPVFNTGATERPHTCELWVACSLLITHHCTAIVTTWRVLWLQPLRGNLWQCSLNLCPWALLCGCIELYPVEGSPRIPWLNSSSRPIMKWIIVFCKQVLFCRKKNWGRDETHLVAWVNPSENKSIDMNWEIYFRSVLRESLMELFTCLIKQFWL